MIAMPNSKVDITTYQINFANPQTSNNKIIVGSRLSQQAKIGLQQRMGHAYTPLNVKAIEREVYNGTHDTSSSALDNSIPQF